MLQFSFAEGMVNPQHGGIEPDTVVYTGTHDNDTTAGWWARGVDARAANGSRPRPRQRRTTRSNRTGCSTASRSTPPGVLAILPAQDVLGLDGRRRTNTPGRPTGNWSWRLRPGQLDASLAARLREATEAADRLPPSGS